MAVSSTGFVGFRPEALQFLVDLAGNNERSWFRPRKETYERLLKQPLESLCEALQVRFEARGLPMRADPKRSPFRIYRDVRFSRDKSPYKTNIGADFPYVEDEPDPGEPIHSRAGGYFHLSPEESFVGGGMWHPEPSRLAAFRAEVDAHPKRVMEALEDPTFAKRFGKINGDMLKRVPTGFAADHPHADLLKLKDVVFGRTLTDEEIFSRDLPDILVADFAAAMPVYRFLSTLATA